jgi:putative spermidine/putrescine transport system permease protein
MTRSRLNAILVVLLATVMTVWLVVPFAMALMWSLVDPGQAWSYPEILPPKLSFLRWQEMWQTTSLATAMLHSYSLAPMAGLSTVLLAMPTAYAFGRLEFRGKSIAQILVLLPLIMPGFVTAIFFASILISMGFFARYPAILLGHIVLFMPYAVRVLSVSFGLVRQDVINAARDLGASSLETFKAAYLPVLKPGIFAAFLIVFVLSIEEFALAFVVGSPSFITIPTILFSYLGYNFILMLVLERLLQSANPAGVSGKG